MMEWFFLALSFVFVFLVLGLSTYLQDRKVLNDEGARKFVHISVAHWWFFTITFDTLWIALIAPLAFIVLNYLSYHQQLFRAIERGGKGNLGTVYFPISLTILVLFTFLVGEGKPYAYIGALAMLTLGYGDGLAALLGKRFGKRSWIRGKTVLGSLVMLGATFVVTLSVFGLYQPNLAFPILFIIAIPFIATLIEMFTPRGLDNLTVPLGVAFISYLYVILLPFGG